MKISLETQQDDIHCLSEVFQTTDVEAALAAGIFHRKEVVIADERSTFSRKGSRSVSLEVNCTVCDNFWLSFPPGPIVG